MPWHVVDGHSKCPASKPWAVVKDSDGSVSGCHLSKSDAQKQVAALYANERSQSMSDDRAAMSSGSINDLPDSAFAYIEPGGKKDANGKTVPRSKRHFPVHDAAHTRNALARAPQSPFGPKAMPKIRAAAKKFGIQVAAQSNSAGPRDIDVVRAVALPQGFEESDQPDDGLGLMTGRFSAIGEWYPVESKFEGRFFEKVAPGAFDRSIEENRSNMRVLFDHGFDPQIGNKVLGPIRSVSGGSDYEVPLFDTSYNRDLLPGLRFGVYGASMRMRVHEETWNDQPAESRYNPDQLSERTITRAEVMEFGPVTFPANPGATAAVRSATDHYYEQLRTRDAGRYEAAVRAVQLLVPDFTGASEARSPGRSERTTPTDRQRVDDGSLRMRGII